jgi:hypothetical protein
MATRHNNLGTVLVDLAIWPMVLGSDVALGWL